MPSSCHPDKLSVRLRRCLQQVIPTAACLPNYACSMQAAAGSKLLILGPLCGLSMDSQHASYHIYKSFFESRARSILWGCAPPSLLSSLPCALGSLLEQPALLLRTLLQLSSHARLLRLEGCALCRGGRLSLLALALSRCLQQGGPLMRAVVWPFLLVDVRSAIEHPARAAASSDMSTWTTCESCYEGLIAGRVLLACTCLSDRRSPL